MKSATTFGSERTRENKARNRMLPTGPRFSLRSYRFDDGKTGREGLQIHKDWMILFIASEPTIFTSAFVHDASSERDHKASEETEHGWGEAMGGSMFYESILY